MTWLELYNYLYKQAEIVNNKNFNWESKVIVYDASSGEESSDCNIYFLEDADSSKEKLVFITNLEIAQ